MNKENALKDLLKFLYIEGVTGNEKKIALEVKKTLIEAKIPEEYIFFDNANKKIPLPTETGNLIVKLPGNVEGDRRLFITHLDTVSLCAGAKPEIINNKIVAKGNTALGGDNRAGVACLVTMLKTIFENNLSYCPMTVLFTVREESGLWGARFVKKADLGNPVYGFNCDGPSPYEIIIGAVGAERWEVEIIGKGSHAGVSPEKGISSTMVASIALATVQKKGWFGKILKNGFSGTSNIGYYGNINGSCAGGTANQVTDYVKIKGECRSKDEEFASIITNEYNKAFNDSANFLKNIDNETAKINFKKNLDYYPFLIDKNSDVVKISQQISKSEKFSGKVVKSNGGLDANWLVRKNIPTITFGNGHYKPHSIDEYVLIDEFYDACKYAISLALHSN